MVFYKHDYFRHAFKATLCRKGSTNSHALTRSYTWRSSITRTTTLSSVQGSQPEVGGSCTNRQTIPKQTSITMALTPGSNPECGNSFCSKEANQCLGHPANTVCFVIHEERIEPDSGSVQSSGEKLVEKKTVKCDVIVKCKQKVSMVRIPDSNRKSNQRCKLDCEESELIKSEKIHTKSDHLIPETILKDEEEDSGTESVLESKDLFLTV